MAARAEGHRAAGGARHSRHRGPLRRHRVRHRLPEGDTRPRRERLPAGQDPPPGDHRHLQPRRHHLRPVAPLRRHGPYGGPQADSPGPRSRRPAREGGRLREQGGLQRTQPGHSRRAAPLQAVVPLHEAHGRHRPAARARRQAQVLSHEVRHDLSQLAREHPGLVHQPSALVGTQDSRLLHRGPSPDLPQRGGGGRAFRSRSN